LVDPNKAKQKKSKEDYVSKAKARNVRGVGKFFVTCSNLDQLFPYNFKNLHGHFPQNFNQKN
jgi:hypothetical protein